MKIRGVNRAGKSEPLIIKVINLNSQINENEFNPVVGLLFDDYVIEVPGNIFVVIPYILSRGIADNCIISPEISDITIVISNNTIIGKFNKNSNITIYCYNTYSDTNIVNLSIKLSDYSEGLIGYYMKYDDFDINSISPNRIDNKVTEVYKRIEKSINHNYDRFSSAWPGLPKRYVNKYGVSWEGYIKIEKTRYYSFNLSSYDYSTLYIDNNLIINNSGHHSYRVNSTEILLTEGFHFIMINYLLGYGSSGIELLYKYDDNKFEDPSSLYYHSSSNIFEYVDQSCVYLQNEEININSLIQTNKLTNCESNPTLPPGLKLNNDCEIYGKALYFQENKNYKITGDYGNSVYPSVNIKIISDIKSNELFFYDVISDTEVDLKNLLLGRYYEITLDVKNSYPIYYNIINIPNGFNYNNNSNTLYGIVSDEIDKEITIHIYYSDNEYKIFTSEIKYVNGCKDSKTMHTVMIYCDNEPHDEISYRITGDNYYNGIVPYGKNPMAITDICITPGLNTFYFKDKNEEGYFNHYYIYNNGVLVYNFTDRNNNGYYHQIYTVVELPPIKYPSNTLNYMLHDYIKIESEILPYYLTSCESNKQLPSNLYLNPVNCSITGYATESVNDMYIFYF